MARARDTEPNRFQFTLSEKHGAKAIEELGRLQHKQWPSGTRSDTEWVRIALRVFFRHNARTTGHEWFVRRTDGTLSPLIASLRRDKSAGKKLDVLLSDADRARLSTLKAKEPNSDAVLLRSAVHFMVEVGTALRRDDELVAGRADRLEQLDLIAIAADDQLPPTTTVEVALQLTTPDEPSAEMTFEKRTVVDDSEEADVLWSTLLFVTTWNRWLAVKDGEVTALAQDISQYSEKTFERIEQNYDLRTLLFDFWSKEQARLEAGARSYLSSQLASHPLIPESWKRQVQQHVLAKARKAHDIVREFIHARFEHLRPGGYLRERSTVSRARARDSTGRPLILWRNWTRSCDLQNGSREIRPPIEWTAVLHHHLSKGQPGGNPELVAHDLQVWLSDTFGIRNKRDFPKLVEGCRDFNHIFYKDASLSGGRVVEETDELLELGQLLNVLSKSSDILNEARPGADRSDAYTAWARFMYLSLTITRCVRPVYHWKLADYGKDEPSTTKEQASKLEAKRFDKVQLRIRAVTYANVADLRARIFGAQTAIDGLHWILRGGIVPRSNRGRVWVVSGRPGSGKSTLGLALASDMARRGHVAIIMLSEERARTVEERLLMLGLRDSSRYDIVSRASFEAMLDGAADQIRAELAAVESAQKGQSGPGLPVKGLLVIFDASRLATRDPHASNANTINRLELPSWLEWISQRSRALCNEIAAQLAESGAQHKPVRDFGKVDRLRGARAARLRALQRRWQWLSLVVDSVDALEIDMPDLLARREAGYVERTGMAKLVQAIEVSRCWGVLVCGEDNPRKPALSYLADTVIELGTGNAGMQRTLQITKCRTQPYDPGLHVLSLVEGTGVLVYPNLPSIQRVLRRRARRHLDSEHVIVIPNRIEWPGTRAATSSAPRKTKARARGKHAAAIARVEQLPVIRRGSAVLMYGDRQSGKRPFLLNLMSQRMKLEQRFRGWKNGAVGAVLILSFRSDGQDCLRPLEESDELQTQWHMNVSDLQFKWYGADDSITAAQVTHELVRRIQWSRRDGVPIDWIAFIGLEALKSTLPLVAAEASFWPTILAIAANEEISTAFVVNDEKAAFVAQHAEDMDYVLRFSRGSRHRQVEIEKSVEAPSRDGYPTLGLDLAAGTIWSAGQPRR